MSTGLLADRRLMWLSLRHAGGPLLMEEYLRKTMASNGIRP
jgi:hypothetical protein